VTEPKPYWIGGAKDGRFSCQLIPLEMNGEPLSTKQLHELITLQAMTIERLYSEVGRLNDVIGLLRNWVKAYPLDMFPEPDLELARKLLTDGGVSYDALNVYSMRHVITELERLLMKL